MNIKEILSEWSTDSVIDKTKIGDESLGISKLHAKYTRIISFERLIKKKIEAELKSLRLKKYEFLLNGHDEETRKLGWELPPRGRILKSDIPMYLDADKDLQELSLKLALVEEKIEILTDIIRSIHNRSYSINGYIDYMKYMHGN